MLLIAALFAAVQGVSATQTASPEAAAALPADPLFNVQHVRERLQAAGYSVREEEGEAPASPTLVAQRSAQAFAVRSYGCFEGVSTCHSILFEYSTSTSRRGRDVARRFNRAEGIGAAYSSHDGEGNDALAIQHGLLLQGGITAGSFQDALARWEAAMAAAQAVSQGMPARPRHARIPSGFTGISPEEVAEAVRNKEFGPAEIRKIRDRFRIYIDYSDELYGEPLEDSFVELADCSKHTSGVRCATLRFRFDGPVFVGADAARDNIDMVWNELLYFAKMTLGPKLERNLSFEQAAAGGLTHDNLDEILRSWVVTVDEAKKFQGTYPD
jgi:hypothetical protein